MAKDKTEKTNVMRLLEQKKLPYTPHDYLASGAVSGVRGGRRPRGAAGAGL